MQMPHALTTIDHVIGTVHHVDQSIFSDVDWLMHDNPVRCNLRDARTDITVPSIIGRTGIKTLQAMIQHCIHKTTSLKLRWHNCYPSRSMIGRTDSSRHDLHTIWIQYLCTRCQDTFCHADNARCQSVECIPLSQLAPGQATKPSPMKPKTNQNLFSSKMTFFLWNLLNKTKLVKS